MEEKAQSQQYLTPWEEDVLIKYLHIRSSTGSIFDGVAMALNSEEASFADTL
jgi:hypothetical protein